MTGQSGGGVGLGRSRVGSRVRNERNVTLFLVFVTVGGQGVVVT